MVPILFKSVLCLNEDGLLCLSRTSTFWKEAELDPLNRESVALELCLLKSNIRLTHELYKPCFLYRALASTHTCTRVGA